MGSTNGENYENLPSIDEIYGDKGFIKVKPNMLTKGKIIFSFVTFKPDKKADKDKSFDVFLDTDEAMAFATICKNGMLFRWTCDRMKEAKDKNLQYPEASWTSSLGVSNGEERKFMLAKAQKGDYLFTAQKRFGTCGKDNQGRSIFHPFEKGQNGYKDPIYVRVPTSEFRLVEMACKIEAVVTEFRLKGSVSVVTNTDSNKPVATNTPVNEQPEDLNIPMPDEIIYPPEDINTLVEDIKGNTEEPKEEPKEDIHLLHFVTLAPFKFENNIGLLRVRVGETECPPLRFEKNLTRGTEKEQSFFALCQKGAVEFDAYAKKTADGIVYCGLKEN